jgi:hypothetical protein
MGRSENGSGVMIFEGAKSTRLEQLTSRDDEAIEVSEPSSTMPSMRLNTFYSGRR